MPVRAKLFWWEAPDGSRLLAFFPHDYVNQMEPMRIARDLADTRRISGLGHMLHLYGVGDHGGGPTRQMLRAGAPWTSEKALYPTTRYGTVLGFFESVKPLTVNGSVRVWKDELYLEYHRGVFTTQARTKKNNRRNETLVLNAEKFASFASLFGAEYPKSALDEAWKKVLFNQFHDILPRETQVRLRLPRRIARAQETNLLEQAERELSVQGQEVVVPTKPYEIKTVRIEMRPQ